MSEPPEPFEWYSGSPNGKEGSNITELRPVSRVTERQACVLCTVWGKVQVFTNITEEERKVYQSTE